MKHLNKRLLALLLVVVMLAALFPVSAFAAERGEAEETRSDTWEAILAYENAHLRKTRNGKQRTAADYAALSGEIAKIVEASEDYKEDTCTYDPDSDNAMFFWEDRDGMPQGYSPALRAKMENGRAAETDPEPVRASRPDLRGGLPSSSDIYVLSPWYGIDSSFNSEYFQEGERLAEATGGSCYSIFRQDVTVDTVARCIEYGAAVLIDTHGLTDYESYKGYTYLDDPGYYVADCVTGAHDSYITLTNADGITEADCQPVYSGGSTYYRCFYFDTNYGVRGYGVDGQVIADHMVQYAPHNMVWVGSCLGMATDGLFRPLRQKGVEVVYGYSESITFLGDHTYRGAFWDWIREGETVGNAITYAKNSYGEWDPAYYNDWYSTLALARKYYVAFPIVVSSEDAYPGKRTSGRYGVDGPQTVRSTWKLAACMHKFTYSADPAPTLYEAGKLIARCGKCGLAYEVAELPCLRADGYLCAVFEAPSYESEGRALFTWQNYQYGTFSFEAVLPKLDDTCDKYYDVNTGKWYHEGIHYMLDNAVMNGVGEHSFDPNGSLTRAMLVTILYRAQGAPSIDGQNHPFTDVAGGKWYSDAITWAYQNSVVNGTSATTFEPDGDITREQLATILYRYAKNIEHVDASNRANLDEIFADANQITAYAREALSWAVADGYMKGSTSNGATKVYPKDGATRAEVATLLMRYLKAEKTVVSE